MRFILPVKDLRRGKSRLHLPERRDLAVAMLRDTLEAVLAAASGPVCLVSPDPDVALLADEYGTELLRHHGGLNEAIAAAATPHRCAVVLPDLPALQAADVVALANHERGFVPDAAGTGTTMAVDWGLIPRFGPGSATAFETAGLPRLPARPGARRDVDSAADLSAAVALGVGRHTGAVLARRRPA